MRASLAIALIPGQVSIPFCLAGQQSETKKPAELPHAAIDINQASAEDFEKLPGIGPELARRIVAYRDKHGPFRRVEDLLVIRGIGPRKWKTIRPYLRVRQEGENQVNGPGT